jgi:hypothetical protein
MNKKEESTSWIDKWEIDMNHHKVMVEQGQKVGKEP